MGAEVGVGQWSSALANLLRKAAVSGGNGGRARATAFAVPQPVVGQGDDTGVLTLVFEGVALKASPTSGSFGDLEGFVEFSAPISFGVAARFLSKVNIQGTLGRVLVDVA